MAGETNAVPSSHGIMPEIEVSDPFDKMNGTLGKILAALTGRDDTTVWELTGGGTVVQSQHVRWRASRVVFSTSVAAVVTLTLGTRTFTFNTAGADTIDVAFLAVIERGTDVSLTASAGAVTGYLVGSPE